MGEVQTHAFDSVAAHYDAEFTDQQLGGWLRAVVWSELDHAFAPGDRVLDLGCGTGADARHLAERGVHVIATDVSDGMLAVARQKTALAGLSKQIEFASLDLRAADGITYLATLSDVAPLAGAYSNFGPLNCVADRRTLAADLSRVIRPGGVFFAVVMSPFCPWETLWYGIHAHPRTAVRRLRPVSRTRMGGRLIDVWYPSPRRLRAEFAGHFEHIKTLGVGISLPPSNLGHLIPKAPRLFARANALDDRLRTRSPFTWLNDHYLIAFRRRETD